MDKEHFFYSNSTDTFSVSHRKVKSHIMAGNHFHNTFELFYLMGGERNFFIKDRTITIKEGDLVLIHPNILHRTTDAAILGHENIIVNFHKANLTAPQYSFTEILSPLFNNEYTIISFPPQNRIYIEELLCEILQEVQQKNTGFEMYSQSLILELLTYCCRYAEQNSLKELTYQSSVHEMVSQIVQFINKNFSQELNLQFLAESFYISPYHLSRTFKEVTGFSFPEYLNNLRIKEAIKLLEESPKKVELIAKAVGYSNRTHFGRVFRKITGHSPLYYRRSEVKKNKL